LKFEPLKNKEKDSMRELIRRGFHTRDVRSAVKFFWLYREDPDELIKDFKRYEKVVRGLCRDIRPSAFLPPTEDYKEWLYNEAFEDVVGGGKNGGS